MPIVTYDGQIELDTNRGVICFHLTNPADVSRLGIHTMVRISRLLTPIPCHQMLDISSPASCNWEAGGEPEPMRYIVQISALRTPEHKTTTHTELVKVVALTEEGAAKAGETIARAMWPGEHGYYNHKAIVATHMALRL